MRDQAEAAGKELRAVVEHAIRAGDRSMRSRALGW
jgi:hypothetical protein